MPSRQCNSCIGPRRKSADHAAQPVSMACSTYAKSLTPVLIGITAATAEGEQDEKGGKPEQGVDPIATALAKISLLVRDPRKFLKASTLLRQFMQQVWDVEGLGRGLHLRRSCWAGAMRQGSLWPAATLPGAVGHSLQVMHGSSAFYRMTWTRPNTAL